MPKPHTFTSYRYGFTETNLRQTAANTSLPESRNKKTIETMSGEQQ
ncbi:hypothetical Protein YC6258_03685 [Gynuella sunshinyii YC6258]|uniref:Uncharacterized protein n=1 Tax=Gynuella sunshinyii YC6258 TaxID=1445510 RepID=A0A0C5VN42_9GAMM|nr:hypothetical Protein YC6258_03685 [Gynuella sunshinyii YC6258]